MKIRIPVVIGSTGRWSAYGYPITDESGVDWALIEENVLDPIGATEEDASQEILRVWVEADVPLPEIVIVNGTAITEEGRDSDEFSPDPF